MFNGENRLYLDHTSYSDFEEIDLPGTLLQLVDEVNFILMC